MKTKDNKLIYSVIAALVIVVMFIFAFSIFSIFNNQKINITLYNEYGQNKTIKINPGSNLDGKIEDINIDGYEFLGWFYDKDLKHKVKENDIFNENHVLIAGFSKIITKTNKENLSINSKYLTIKTSSTKLNLDDFNLILNLKPKYLNLFEAEVENNILIDNLFENQNELETIILPKNLITIGKYTFKNCYNLSNIILNDSLKNIDNNAFYNCISLKDINLENNIEYLGASIFEGINKLDKITIGKNVLTILPKAFYGTEIKEILIDKENSNYILENNIIYSSDYKSVLYCLSSYNGNLVLNDNIERIEDYAFYGCKNIESIIFSNNINYVGYSAFENCSNLENIKFKESKNYIIYDKAFKNCNNLKNVTFDVGLKSILNNAFENCVKLETVNFKISTQKDISNLENIGSSSFKNCKTLNSFVMPDTVYSIGNEIFSDCKNLKHVDLSARINLIPYKMFFNNINLNKVVATSQIDKIEDYAFYGCENLINISTLNDAKELGFAAFKNCKNINNISFNNIEILNEEVFYGCEKLINISINNIKELKRDCFSYSGLIKFNINQSIELIDKDAFSSADYLEEFLIDNNFNFYVEDGVLYNKEKNAIICYPNNKLSENFTIKANILNILGQGLIKNQNIKNINVELSNNIYSSEDGILYNKEKTQLIKYPNGKTNSNVNIINGITDVNSYALAYNKNITNLTISNSVIHFNKNILYNSNNLITLKIPFIGETKLEEEINTKFIGYLFGGETYLTNNDYVPSSLINVIITNNNIIDEYSFYEANNISYIEFIKDISVINKFAFYGCEELKEIYFNEKIQVIKEKAIYNLKNLETLNIVYNLNMDLEKNSIGEIRHSVEVYIDNKTGQNIPQLLKNTFRTKFFTIYSLSKNWKWFF